MGLSVNKWGPVPQFLFLLPHAEPKLYVFNQYWHHFVGSYYQNCGNLQATLKAKVHLNSETLYFVGLSGDVQTHYTT